MSCLEGTVIAADVTMATSAAIGGSLLAGGVVLHNCTMACYYLLISMESAAEAYGNVSTFADIW